jgi:Xaa-Pro aminopeptidase
VRGEAAGRVARLRAAMAAGGVEALLVTDRVDVRWLTGFTGSAGVAHVTADGPVLLVTDGRYAERAAEEAPAVEVVLDRTWGWLAARHGAGPLWVQADHLPWAEVRTLQQDLEVRPTTGLVATLRQRKDDAEIATLRRACALTDAAFADALGWLAPGLAEAAVARRLVGRLQDLGADGSAFPPIVAAGPNGSRPHHDPGHRALQAGDLVTLDFGALVDGYHADMTRTVALGEPDPALARIHDLVRAAQDAGVAAAVAGADVVAVDRAGRALIAAAGHGGHFPHGTGHGVGLAIHETPFLGPSAAGTLADRMTVTVEPGVYVPGLGGVRIEDVVLVTDAGPERLTTSPRELVRL